MIIHNATITGSLTLDGIDISSVTGSTAVSSSLVELSSSFIATSSSLSTRVTTNEQNIATLQTASSSLTAKVNVIETSYATTGSNQFSGSQSITGSLTVTGQVIAQTLNVQQVTSSIVYSSGSNVFGNNIGNTQQFTGSVLITGSVSVNGVLSGTSLTMNGGGTFGALTTLGGNGENLRITTTGVGNYIAFRDSSNVQVGDIGFDGRDTGGLSIWNNNSTGSLVFGAGAARALTIASTGAATFSSTIAATKGYFSSNSAVDSSTAILANASTNDNTTYAAIFGSLNAGYRMVVRADGNVGINTTNPTTTLNVNGTTSSGIFTVAYQYHGIKFVQSDVTTTFTVNLATQFPQMLLTTGNSWGVIGKINLLKGSGGGSETLMFSISRDASGNWGTATIGLSSNAGGAIVSSITGSGSSITINTSVAAYMSIELTVMIR